MATATVCDNCKAVLSDYSDLDPAAWLVVGWKDGPRFDACSPECAAALVADRLGRPSRTR